MMRREGAFDSEGAIANSPDRTVWPVLAALVLLGAGLRVYQLDSGLWFDEIKTLIDSVRSPLLDIVTQFPGNNDHLLFSVLAHLSVSAFGEHAWSLRLPAAIFGIATIPMLYLFGTKVTTRQESFLATSLLTVSYHHIWFSQNARGYAMLLFWCLLTSYLLLVGLRDNKRSTFIGFAVVSALGVYSHLTMVFIVFAQAVVAAWHVVHVDGAKISLRNWVNPALGFVLAGLITLIFYAPVLLEVQTFFEKATVSSAIRVATPGWAVLAAFRGLNIGFTVAGGVFVAGVLFFAGCWSYLRQSPAVCLLFILPVPIILAAAIVLQRPVFPRFFFFFMGFGLLIAVRGAMVVGEWAAGHLRSFSVGRGYGAMLPTILVFAMIALSAFALPSGYRYPKQDYEGALQFVDNVRKDGETVVVVGAGAAIPYRLYYGRNWPWIDSVEKLNSARARGNAVWLLFTLRQYIEKRQPELLTAILAECESAKTFPGTVGGGAIAVYKCPA